MRTSCFAAIALLLTSAGMAQAACTQADARARMDTINALMAGVRRGTPEYNRASAVITPIIQEGQVTESTCARLDALIAEIRR